MRQVPWVSFAPLQKENEKDILNKFEDLYHKSVYIQGDEYEKFNKEFAEYCGVKYAIGVGNGLDALMLILRACNIGEGDEVIIPSNTFIATALAVTYVGAKPIFVEPILEEYNINPALIEEKINSRTKEPIGSFLIYMS